MSRFQVHDDVGALRVFVTRREALRWMASRPEFRLVVLPKRDPLAGALPAVF
jgi:hypothetical protein